MPNQTEFIYLFSAIIGGAVIGTFCGSLPLVVGIIRKKLWLGFVGLGVCIIFGIIMTTILYQPAFLSIFPSAVITCLIFLLTRK